MYLKPSSDGRQGSKPFDLNRLIDFSVFSWVLTLLFLLAGLSQAPQIYAQTVRVLESVTFAKAPQDAYVPLQEVADAFGWQVADDKKYKRLKINNQSIDPKTLRKLLDGTNMIEIDALTGFGVTVSEASLGVYKDYQPYDYQLELDSLQLGIRIGVKKVRVNLTTQTLSAYQGDRLVLQTHISSGKDDSTPTGYFTAGPIKEKMHYSSLYNQAPMPWSIQINGDVFIHGAASVPPYPASHGCVRVPLDKGNPAKALYEWIEIGTPVEVFKEKVALKKYSNVSMGCVKSRTS